MVLPGKRGHSELVPSKTVCPNPGIFSEEFHNIGLRKWGIADKDQGVCGVCTLIRSKVVS